MADPEPMLTKLKDEFKRWEDVLCGLNEAQATTSRLPNGWSVKDLTAHLMAWQQVSVGRLEAGNPRLKLSPERVAREVLAGLEASEPLFCCDALALLSTGVIVRRYGPNAA